MSEILDIAHDMARYLEQLRQDIRDGLNRGDPTR